MKLSRTHEERLAECGIWKDKFAWWPTEMDDQSLIWLETYEWKEDRFVVPGVYATFVESMRRKQ